MTLSDSNAQLVSIYLSYVMMYPNVECLIV